MSDVRYLRDSEEWKPLSVMTDPGLEQGQAEPGAGLGAVTSCPPCCCSTTLPWQVKVEADIRATACLFTHLDVIPDEDLVVDHKLVVLQHAVEAGVGPLDVPHEPAHLGQSGGG